MRKEYTMGVNLECDLGLQSCLDALRSIITKQDGLVWAGYETVDAIDLSGKPCLKITAWGTSE